MEREEHYVRPMRGLGEWCPDEPSAVGLNAVDAGGRCVECCGVAGHHAGAAGRSRCEGLAVVAAVALGVVPLVVRGRCLGGGLLCRESALGGCVRVVGSTIL